MRITLRSKTIKELKDISKKKDKSAQKNSQKKKKRSERENIW